MATRFLGYGWNVLRVGDANDLEMLARAFDTFQETTDRPTLIIVDSHIAYGAPHKQDTSAAHGEPLGEEEIRLTKRNYGWPEDAKFLVPDGVYEHFQEQHGRSAARNAARRLDGEVRRVQRQVSRSWPSQLQQMQKRELPDGLGHGHSDLPAPMPRAWRAATRPAKC